MYIIHVCVTDKERLVFLSDDAIFSLGLSYCSGYNGIVCSSLQKVSLDDVCSLVQSSGTQRYVLCIRDRTLFWPVWARIRNAQQPYLILIDAGPHVSPAAPNNRGVIFPKRIKAERFFSCLRQFSTRRRHFNVGGTPRGEYIIRQLCQGKSVYTIGLELGISSKTVQAHKYNYLKQHQLHYYNGLGILWLGELQRAV